MKRAATALLAILLLAANAPAHVQTADYFGGYAGTHDVAPAAAARWLSWAETNVNDSPVMRALGVKTLLYTDPNRQLLGQSYFARDESAFAHDCSGNRVTANRRNQFLMDPHSAALAALWKQQVDRYDGAGHFSAVFADDADDVAYVHGVPCHYNDATWLAATNTMQRSLDRPIVYNGLSNFTDRTVSQSIGLNASSIGGVMEGCYARSPAEPKEGGDAWYVAEATELRMMQEGKFFFCYGNDTTAADRSLDPRLYVYASFLLSYDPRYAVLWEYYQGPLRFHVMPEVQVVPLQPRGSLTSIDGARTADGVYVRRFGACYVAGMNAGACAVAVNPDGAAHPVPELAGYRRTLQLSGGGALDGGSIHVGAPSPRTVLGPLEAVIAFR